MKWEDGPGGLSSGHVCVCVSVCSFVIIIAFNVLGRYKKMENSLLG